MQLQTLGDLWQRNARLFPQTEAVVFGSVRRTYAEVIERAHRLASALHCLGARKQDRIALLARNRAEWFDYYAACELHGYIASTLNFRLAAEELFYILKDAGSSHLIFEDDYTALVEELRPRLTQIREFICIGAAPPWARSYEDLLAEADPNGPPDRAAPSDAVRLIYTSGTTGKPKGVLRSQSADLALARVCSCTTEMRSGCRELIVMPMFHIGGQSMASGAAWSGGTVILHRELNPADILHAIEAERVNVLHVTPTIVQAILDQPDIERFDLSSLESVLYAAAPMPVPLLKRAIARLGDLFINCYGSTEAGASIILQRRFHKTQGTPQELERIGSLGQEHCDSRVRIVDDKGQDCPPDTAGEILLRSAGMMSGYWKNPDATHAALNDGWLRTGDIGRMDSQGFVYLVDRKSDMIISGGENIYSREVENALCAHPAVKDAAVIAVADNYWGEAVKAIVVLQPGSQLTAESLIADTARRIARYKLPKSVEFVDKLPLLPSAKIDKVSLRRQYGARPSAERRKPQ